MVGQVIGGLVLAGAGFIFVWKTEWFLRNFGRVGFAEKHLGTEGGSRLLYKLIGTLVIIIGILYAVNLMDSLLEWLIRSIFRV